VALGRRGVNNVVVARASVVAAVSALALVLALPAEAAAPNYILVSGPQLAQPILLGDWNENLRLLSSVANAPRARGAAVRGLARRPRLDLAEFWGYSLPSPPTRPSDATQHGWLYPAHRSRPAVVVLMVDGSKVPRLVPVQARRIFARHGVPLRL
jgi:hypothetical protein